MNNHKIVNRDYYYRNSGNQQSSQRKFKYGITEEQYQERFQKQNGKCALCGNSETQIIKRTGELYPLSVDHDHVCCPGRRSCGKCIRGLICSHCNRGLANFRDNIPNLERAIEYLKGNNKQ